MPTSKNRQKSKAKLRKQLPDTKVKVKNVEKEETTKTKTKSAERSFDCSICPKNCKTQRTLQLHVNAHHSKVQHVCQFCGRMCPSNGSLHRHERTHTGERKAVCNECGKKFGRMSTLRVHERTHTGKKPYGCPECQRQFSQSASLAGHLQLHRGEKPFRCEVCGKEFGKKNGLTRHALIHTGIKPHQCKFCGKGFSQSNTLDDHVKIHTGVRPHRCSVCSKTFIQRSHLHVHMRRHTPAYDAPKPEEIPEVKTGPYLEEICFTDNKVPERVEQPKQVVSKQFLRRSKSKKPSSAKRDSCKKTNSTSARQLHAANRTSRNFVLAKKRGSLEQNSAGDPRPVDRKSDTPTEKVSATNDKCTVINNPDIQLYFYENTGDEETIEETVLPFVSTESRTQVKAAADYELVPCKTEPAIDTLDLEPPKKLEPYSGNREQMKESVSTLSSTDQKQIVLKDDPSLITYIVYSS